MGCDDTLNGFCGKLKAVQKLTEETLNERDNPPPWRLAKKIQFFNQVFQSSAQEGLIL